MVTVSTFDTYSALVFSCTMHDLKLVLITCFPLASVVVVDTNFRTSLIVTNFVLSKVGKLSGHFVWEKL